MKTIEDVIMLEHVGKCWSTRQAIEFLGIPDEYRFNGAGNMYLSALNIIEKQQKEINSLKLSIKRNNDLLENK